MTANALASISLEPPLFMVSINCTSNTLSAIMDSRRFCINLLSERQMDVCRLFASARRDKFGSVRHTFGVTGSPLISGALAHGECNVETTHAAGDQTIVLGRVVRIAVHDANPLVYHRGVLSALRAA